MNGKPDGLQVFWHTNGVKSVEWGHKEGYPHGEIKSYHQNGQLKQLGAFKEGKKNGNWAAWDENGLKIREAMFLNGALITEKKFGDDTENNETESAPNSLNE